MIGLKGRGLGSCTCQSYLTAVDKTKLELIVKKTKVVIFPKAKSAPVYVMQYRIRSIRRIYISRLGIFFFNFNGSFFKARKKDCWINQCLLIRLYLCLLIFNLKYIILIRSIGIWKYKCCRKKIMVYGELGRYPIDIKKKCLNDYFLA